MQVSGLWVQVIPGYCHSGRSYSSTMRSLLPLVVLSDRSHAFILPGLALLRPYPLPLYMPYHRKDGGGTSTSMSCLPCM